MKFNTGIILASSILLTACGGGGGGESDSTVTATPHQNNDNDTPTETQTSLIDISAKDGNFRFEWGETEVAGNKADCYRISIKHNDAESYQELDNCVTDTSFTTEFSVINTKVTGLSYLIEACTDGGTCETIDSITPSNNQADLFEHIPFVTMPGLETLGHRTLSFIPDGTTTTSFRRLKFGDVFTMHHFLLSKDESTAVYIIPHDASTGNGVYADPTLGRNDNDEIDAELPPTGAMMVVKKQGDEWVIDAFIKPPQLEDSSFTKVARIGHDSLAFPRGLSVSGDGNTIAVPFNTCGNIVDRPPHPNPDNAYVLKEFDCTASLLVYQKEGYTWSLTDNIPHSTHPDMEGKTSYKPLEAVKLSGDGKTIIRLRQSGLEFHGIINYPYADQIFGHVVETSYSDDYQEPFDQDTLVKIQFDNTKFEVLYFIDHIDRWVTQALVSNVFRPVLEDEFSINRDYRTILSYDGGLILQNQFQNNDDTIMLARNTDIDPTWKTIAAPLTRTSLASSNTSGNVVAFHEKGDGYNHKIYLRDGDNFTPYGQLPPVVVHGEDMRQQDRMPLIINDAGNEILIRFRCGECGDNDFILSPSYPGYHKMGISEFQQLFISATEYYNQHINDYSSESLFRSETFFQISAFLHFKRIDNNWVFIGMLNDDTIWNDLHNPYIYNQVEFINAGIRADRHIIR